MRAPAEGAGRRRAFRSAFVAIKEGRAKLFGLDVRTQTSVPGEDGGPVHGHPPGHSVNTYARRGQLFARCVAASSAKMRRFTDFGVSKATISSRGRRRLFARRTTTFLRATGVTTLVLMAGCAHLQSLPTPTADILQAFDAARHEIESRTGPIEVVWLSAGVDPQVEAVLKRERQASGQKQLSGTVVAVPENYFLVESFSVESTRGKLSGVVGPRSSPPTMGACGKGFDLNLDRGSGTWRAVVVSGRVC